MENKKAEKERFFSIELKSKTNLKNLTLANGSFESVLVEGTIGELVHAEFEEDSILEIAGTKGSLRINLKAGELKQSKNVIGEVR